MRSRYKFISEGGIYFLTSAVVDWLPIFTAEPYFQILLESLSFCQAKKGLRIYAYVILDNHFHLVAKHLANLSRVIQSLKIFTAHQIIAQLTSDGKNWALQHLESAKKPHKTQSRYQVWQEGSHPQLIVDERMLEQKIEYIHFNPVRRGLVREPQHWRYSSAANYVLGDDSILQMDDIGED